MTLKVIVDNTVELPVVNLSDVPANLRLLADSIERGETAALRSCVHILVYDHGLSTHISGENCSAYELMGLFEAAKLRVFADDITEE